jgi:type IV pilus assembly protein PilM
MRGGSARSRVATRKPTFPPVSMARASKSGRKVVGLEVEPTRLAAAEATVNGRVAVERAAVAPLAPGLVRDGEVTDADGLAGAMKAFFSEHKLRKRVRLGVANQRIVVRIVDLPPLEPGRELDAAVRFQAQEHLPMSLDQAVLDYQPLGRVETEQGERTRVVLVAARRDMIERLLAAVRGAGLRVEGIDLSAFAMIRALRSAPQLTETDIDGQPGGTLYVSVGGMTNLAIAAREVCLFTRVTTSGMDGMVTDLAERRGLTREHSEQWLRHTGLEAPLDALEGDPEIVSDARSVLAAGVDRIVDEVRNSLDFYSSQGTGVPVEQAVVTGPAVGIPGFVAQLDTGLAVPVAAGAVAESRPGALDGLQAGDVTVAAGLAVAEVGS